MREKIVPMKVWFFMHHVNPHIDWVNDVLKMLDQANNYTPCIETDKHVLNVLVLFTNLSEARKDSTVQ